MKKVTVFCSMVHLEKNDVHTLKYVAMDERSMPWVFDTTYGYILDLAGFRHPLLKLKTCGLSKSARRFVYHMQKQQGADYLHFDCDADVIPGETTFNW